MIIESLATLAIRIHEGLVFSNRCKRTLLDKVIALLAITEINQPYYFGADAYYASGKIMDVFRTAYG